MDNLNAIHKPHPELPAALDQEAVTPAEFQEGFGEDIHSALDVDTWRPGEDLDYHRIEEEVRDAIAQEGRARERIRKVIFPRLRDYPSAPPQAGVYAATPQDLEHIHKGLLFNGGAEACDGTRRSHDTLPLTIFQIGISLVSYRGNQGTWGHRLFRRDLRVSGADPTEEMLALLERREQRGGLNQPSRRDRLSDLAGRGIMAHAERAILLRRSEAIWRIGHGNPAPYELLTGSGSLDLMIEATKVIRELVEGHQKFLFVTSEGGDRFLQSIGQALYPLEYAVVGRLKERIDATVDNGHYRMHVTSDTRWDGVKLTPEEWIKKFRDVVSPQVVVGVYRATRMAPPQIFYAHQDHVHAAAHLAMADSVLQEHRGFPLLIDLADNVCTNVFGPDTLDAPTSTAYADAGAPWRYLSERATRYK